MQDMYDTRCFLDEMHSPHTLTSLHRIKRYIRDCQVFGDPGQTCKILELFIEKCSIGKKEDACGNPCVQWP